MSELRPTLTGMLLNACIRGNFEEADNILLENTDNDLIELFLNFCHFGITQGIEWLLSRKVDFDISVHNELGLKTACKHGKLKVCELLISKKPDINISIDNELPLRIACFQNKLHIVEWLFNKKNNIDFSAKNNFIMKKICKEGYVDIMLFINSKRPDILRDAYLFNFLYNKSHKDIIKWLNILYPERVEIVKKINIAMKFQDKKEECSVCYEIYANMVTNCCRHSFCVNCILIWTETKKNKTCPCCRFDFVKMLSTNISIH